MITTYHLLTTTELRTLQLDSHLVWPTVVAKRGADIVGRFGTLEYDQAVVAGDLWLAPGVSGRIVVRLTQMYELALRSLGLSEYMVAVEVNDRWNRVIKKLGVFEYMQDVDDFSWYRRRIREQQKT